MQGPDHLNLVLLEIEGQHENVSAQGYGVVPQIVLTTVAGANEVDYFRQLLDLHLLHELRLDGPEVERTIVLPPGAGLVVRVLGDPNQRYGRLEFIEYEGIVSRNLYSRAVPPACGMLSVEYLVADLDVALRSSAVCDVMHHGVVSTVHGRGRMASASSSSGFRVDLFEI